MAETGVGYSISNDCEVESKDDWKTRQEKEYEELFKIFKIKCTIIECMRCYADTCPFIIFQKIIDGNYKRRKS